MCTYSGVTHTRQKNIANLRAESDNGKRVWRRSRYESNQRAIFCQKGTLHKKSYIEQARKNDCSKPKKV